MSPIKGTAAVLALACVAACVAACAAETKNDTSGAADAQAPAADAEAAQPADAGAGVPVPETVEMDGVGTVRKAGDLLFAGQPGPDGLRALAAAGYRTVLNTRGEGELDWDEKALAEELGMRFEQIPMPYPIDSIPDEWVDRFDALMKDAPRPMVAHCSSGNRVAGLWAVWLAERQGVAPARAVELGKLAGMTRIGPVVEQRLARDAQE